MYAAVIWADGGHIWPASVKVRWICNVKAKDDVTADSLLSKLGIQDVDVVLSTNKMRWLWNASQAGLQADYGGGTEDTRQAKGNMGGNRKKLGMHSGCH